MQSEFSLEMDMDIWGQLAVEASQVYLTDGTKRSPFADTVVQKYSQFILSKKLKIISG